MTDDSPQPAARRPLTGFRKLMFIAGALFMAWIFLAQTVHRYFPSPHTITVPVPKETAPVERPASPEAPKEHDDSTAELRERISQLEGKIKTLEESIAAAPKPAPTESPVADGRVAHLEEEVKSMQAQMGEVQAGAARKMSAWAMLETLKENIAHGQPFGPALESLAQATPDNAAVQAAIAQLKPHAQGIATAETLQSKFEAVLPAALSKEGGLAHRLETLIRIRKVGAEQTGGDDESIVARAEAKLAHHDVAGSVKELDALSPQAAKVFALWMAEAHGFLNAQSAIGVLELALVENAPAPTPTPPPPIAPATPSAPAPGQ